MYSILLVEDEPKTASSIQQGLKESGYEVWHAGHGVEGMRLFREHEFHLIITDVVMPQQNGIQFCREVRTINDVIPILFLSALGLMNHKTEGYQVGGDDYLVKPFDFSELLLKVKALLRRNANMANHQPKRTVGDLTVHIHSMEVFRNQERINLTAKEFSLLHYFLDNPGRVISKEEIAQKVWNIEFDTGTNFIEVYISYLRNKLEKNSSYKFIHTRKGLGYLFEIQ